jgi:purine-binding chemotaxis protein CheW
MDELLLTFHAEQMLLGVPLDSVCEVLSEHPITRVPLAPDCVGGLLNLRGQILLALDLRRRLMLQPGPPELVCRHIIVRGPDELFSLLVDEIGDVITLEAQGRERVPERLPAQVRELATGVYKLPGRLLLTLDVDRLYPSTGGT